MTAVPEIVDRFRLIEDRLLRVETHLEHVATKADLKELENTLIKWAIGLTGVIVVLVGLVDKVVRP